METIYFVIKTTFLSYKNTKVYFKYSAIGSKATFNKLYAIEKSIEKIGNSK